MFWFGKGEKSELIKKCISSWKKFAPDYEIVEWTEDNFDVNFCQRSKQAYLQKKWAFVADIARLKVIFEQGGISRYGCGIDGTIRFVIRRDKWFVCFLFISQ